MGYCSYVRMVIQGPKELILTGFCALNLTGDASMLDATREWRIMDDGVQKTAGEPDVSLAVAVLGQGGVDWKWYTDYEDVQAHVKIFQHFEELYGSSLNEPPHSLLCGAFGRIGEDVNDIKTRYWGDEPYELLSIQRSIDCTYDQSDAPDLRVSLAQA